MTRRLTSILCELAEVLILIALSRPLPDIAVSIRPCSLVVAILLELISRSNEVVFSSNSQLLSFTRLRRRSSLSFIPT